MRIQTDSIQLIKPYDFTKLSYYPKPEQKSTAIFNFKSLNSFTRKEIIDTTDDLENEFNNL